MLTVLIRYKGEKDNVRGFVNEMVSNGVVKRIREEEGNLRYEYCFPLEEDRSVLLVDSSVHQESLDRDHTLPFMKEIKLLRKKY